LAGPSGGDDVGESAFGFEGGNVVMYRHSGEILRQHSLTVRFDLDKLHGTPTDIASGERKAAYA
jgi:hypothetical protein